MIRWGILGTGKINTKMIPAIQEATNAELVAIASRSARRAKTVAEQYNIPQSYGSYEDLLEDTSINAVYLPLPNHLHKEWVIRSANAGKHILCEKPFALSQIDANQMLDRCKEAGVMVMEAFMYRFNPIIDKILQIIDNDEIGELKAIEFTFAHNLVGYIREDDNYRYHSEFGGGALLDLGVYGISLCNILTGTTPEVVSAIGHQDELGGIDLTSQIGLNYPENIICKVTSSFVYYGRHLLISGSEGSISVDDLVSTDTNEIKVTSSHGNKEIFSTEAFNHYRAQVEHLSQCIRDDKDPKITPQDTLDVIAIVEQCFENMTWI